ncbi:MAG: carboxypeptidase-like regulatory domain-containing protein [Candidatus Thermoplasmatota archaeon]|nr:carboxypeptidase-like regulatory domain-containing protein [Candidatus Thermoplasmatota archaeon]
MAGGRTILLALLLASVAMVGCLGDDEPTGEGGLKQTATIQEGLGGVQGVITDAAVQPVVGANVTLVELNETVQTASDGSYAISNVQPGSYTLIVRAPGFVSTSQDVQVRASDVAVVDLIITHLRTEEAYTQMFEMAGFFECGFEVGWNVSQAPDEVPANPFFLGIALCAGGENVTNDRFSHPFDLEAPIHTLVHEMTWEASGQFSEWMTVSENVRGVDPNDAIGRYMRVQGPSPIQVTMGPEVWNNLSASFKTACEDGDDTYCGYNFRDNGWPLLTRVFPAWQCQSEEAGACAVLQQEFTHVITAFYNGPAPEGYTALS